MPKYKLAFATEALEDVKEAASYYDSQLKGLGKRFKEHVKVQLLLLKENPHTHSVRYSDVRLAVIDKFPYSIHYTIEADIVNIHSVLCDYRNPAEYWVKR